jgi:hypothetical protein
MGRGLTEIQDTHIDYVVACQAIMKSNMNHSGDMIQHQKSAPTTVVLVLIISLKSIWTEVYGQNSRNNFFLQYRSVVFIIPACARNLNGASASEPSPAPQILKHSLIHPAIILPQNQTKSSYIQIPNPLRDLMQCGSCGDIPAPGHLIFSC